MQLIHGEQAYKNRDYTFVPLEDAPDTEPVALPQIKVDQAIVPPIPFIWYRENCFYSSIEYIAKIKPEIMTKMLNGYIQRTDPNDGQTGIKDMVTVEDDCYIIIQRNPLEKAHLYVCLHSYMYYNIYLNNKKSTFKEYLMNNTEVDGGKILQIAPYYYKDGAFYVTSYSNHVKFLNGYSSLKHGETVRGSVFIHDQAFSPPGVLNFTVDDETQISSMFVSVSSPTIPDAKCTCLFIIVNDLKPEQTPEVDKMIKSLIQKVDTIGEG